MNVFLKYFFVIVSIVLISVSVIAAPPVVHIPDRTIYSDNSFYNGIIDLWEFTNDETPDAELVFTMLSESNTHDLDCFIDDGRYIDCAVLDDRADNKQSVIDLKVVDLNGEITIDPFVIFLKDGGHSSLNLCNDIDIRSSTIHIDEKSEEIISVRINNLAGEEFEIDDIRVTENDSEIRVGNETWNDDRLDIDEDTDLEFNLEAFNVSRNEQANVEVEIRGKFENGTRCNFSDIQQDIRVVVEENNDSSSSVCRDIEINGARIRVGEDDNETVKVKIENNNRRDFDIDFVSVSENSPDFKVSIVSWPSDIGGGNEEIVKLRFRTDRVSDDETDNITLKISGEYSNGKKCSSSSVREQIRVTVEDKGSSSSNSDNIEISFSPSSLVLNSGDEKFITATIENKDNSRECVDLEFTLSNSNFTADVSDRSFCIDGDNEKKVDIDIRARTGAAVGSYTGKLIAEFGSKKSSKNIRVNIMGSPPAIIDGKLEIVSFPSTISLVSNETERINVTISNSSSKVLSNVAVTMDNLPEGVFFQPFFKQTLEKGEIVTVIPLIETSNATPGQFDAILVVSADGKTESKNVSITISGSTPLTQGGLQSPLSGFTPLARTVGIGMVLLAFLVIVVVIIALIVRK